MLFTHTFVSSGSGDERICVRRVAARAHSYGAKLVYLSGEVVCTLHLFCSVRYGMSIVVYQQRFDDTLHQYHMYVQQACAVSLETVVSRVEHES